MTINPSFVRHGEEPLRFFTFNIAHKHRDRIYTGVFNRHCLLKGFLVVRLAVSRCGYYSINGIPFYFATKKRAIRKREERRNKNGKSFDRKTA